MLSFGVTIDTHTYNIQVARGNNSFYAYLGIHLLCEEVFGSSNTYQLPVHLYDKEQIWWLNIGNADCKTHSGLVDEICPVDQSA